MRYEYIITGTFISRPNRFIAMVDVSGTVERCHVKNTGRCKELLIEGTKVFLSKSDNPSRSTKYDLIAVMKGDKLINMDSQIPNYVAAEKLISIPLFSEVTKIKNEFIYGDSRIDLMAEGDGKKYLIEVKGVTLENDGVVMFPDAPTERGTKHIRELMHSIKDGYIPCLLFVVQMDNVLHFEPNKITDPIFSKTLKEAKECGVHILAYTCDVKPDSISLKNEIDVIL